MLLSENRFTKNPIKCVIYDPIKGENRRTYVMLGDVPKTVMTACRRYDDCSSKQYDNVLREFYGASYKAKLGLNIAEHKHFLIHWETARERKATGGGQYITPLSAPVFSPEIAQNMTPILGADEDSDIEALLNAPLIGSKNTSSGDSFKPRGKSRVSDVMFESGIEYISDVHIYPEDKFSELKEKIYIATNIPAYRQHMFYIDRNRPRITYAIHAGGMYNVDIRNIKSDNSIQGIPIDKTIYDNRDSIRVEARDTLLILAESLSFDNTVYVVDLAQFTGPKHTQLLDIINDTYRFDLLYYGFVVKYYPQLTQECFYDFVRDESAMVHKYPELAKNPLALSGLYSAEKSIVSADYRGIARTAEVMEKIGVTIAITQMTASVKSNRVMVNIRNLFDKMRVSRCIPEIRAHIDHDNKKYLLRKKHIRNSSDILFPSVSTMKHGITIAVSLRKSDQMSFHDKKTFSTIENEQNRYLFLNIHPNGRYFVRTRYNEEDELGFNKIIKIIKKFTDPIITGINNLGKYVFVTGSNIPLLTANNVTYQGLNVCIFWKKVMSNGSFKNVRQVLDMYMRARIIGPRNVQQFDRYEFLFRKGMFEFDTSDIDRIISASSNISLTNQYAYLSNGTVKQKWDQSYDGRVVRLTHRTTDVRFEVIDIREREFQIFYQYIISLIHRVKKNPEYKESLTEIRSYKNVKRLRKLREQDPALFNLKKYGSKKVYSIICQNQRQPLIYTEDELKSMSARDIKNLTQYWNFTLNKPAFYGCPNKNYQHLSFIVGVHPKHYCLPCCNKKQQTAASNKRAEINETCLRKHKFLATQTTNISHHVTVYGKDIHAGRLSKLPRGSVSSLMFDTLTTPKLKYYLYGVSQHLPGVTNIGIVHSVAAAMEITVAGLVGKIIAELRRPVNAKLFDTLVNGELTKYFRDMKDLINTLTDVFVDMKLFTSPLQKFTIWSELFMELFHLLLDIRLFVFMDAAGNGSAIDLFISDMLISELGYLDRLRGCGKKSTDENFESTLTKDHVYVIIIKKENDYYPIFVADQNTYFKLLEIDERRFSYNSKIIQILRDVVVPKGGESQPIEKVIDLLLLKDFANNNPEWKIEKKFINRQNLCYALMMTRGSDHVYVPIDYSVHIADSIEISFKAFLRKNYQLPNSLIIELTTAVNAFIKMSYTVGDSTGDTGDLFYYALLSPNNYVKIRGGDDVIGVDYNGLLFYFTDADSLDNKLPVQIINYDYNQINQLIIDRHPAKEDRRTQGIGESLYKNYMYQLFVIEFANYLNSERNDAVRGKIRDLIQTTDFKKGLKLFRESLHDILATYPLDIKTINGQLATFYRSARDKKVLLKSIHETVYDFDHITVDKLRGLQQAELKSRLTEISQKFAVEMDLDPTNIKFPNIFIPCGEMQDKTGYCKGKKLIVNRPIADLIDVVAADLTDTLKSRYILTSMLADAIVDYMKFTPHSTEVITVYQLAS